MEQDWSRRPIAEHCEHLRGISLISSMHTAGDFVDAIAVVVSFTEIKSTRGKDYSRSLIVCDPSAAIKDRGLLVQFYRPSMEQLPRPAVGSIILLKSFKLFAYRNVIQAWTHHSSQWLIYDPNGKVVLSKSLPSLMQPLPDVVAYIQRLAGWWKTRSGMSSTIEVAVPQNIDSVTSHSTGRATINLKDLREGHFCDVYGYVIKTYPSRDDAFTVYLSDYTKNTKFHDYVYGESAWKGPYGQYTVQVTLWDSHAHFARQHVHDDQYIFLRNVYGKRGEAGRLEAVVRGDRQNPSKVNVVLVEPSEPRVKAIKLRRAQYEAQWKVEKEKLDEEAMLEQQADRAMQLTPPAAVNPNLSTSYAQVPFTAVGDILAPPFVPQAERIDGPGARKKPHRFRTIARIIDFWPTDLRDFSRPFCMSCQATYEPSEAQIQSVLQGRPECCTICGAPKDADDPDTYEISFTILIEGQDCVCMPVIFSGDDVETLLGEHIVPCNLYLPENVTMLNRLREKLFLFWGNLEESFNAPPQKKHKQDSKQKKSADEPSLIWNEMCIMEYWVNEAAGQAGWAGRRFKGFGMVIL